MITYKGTDSKMRCRGFQYSFGKTFEEKDTIRLCEKGFHSCWLPIDCLNYYSGPDKRYFKVEAFGKTDKRDSQYKIVSSKIKFLKEISVKNLIETTLHNFGKYKKKKNTKIFTDFYIPKRKYEGYSSHYTIENVLNNKSDICVVARRISNIYTIGNDGRFTSIFEKIYAIGNSNFFTHTSKCIYPYIYIEGDNNLFMAAPCDYSPNQYLNPGKKHSICTTVKGNENDICIVDTGHVYIDGENNTLRIYDCTYIEFSDKSKSNILKISSYIPKLVFDSKNEVIVEANGNKKTYKGHVKLTNLIPHFVE